jgi:hypothetical protein
MRWPLRSALGSFPSTNPDFLWSLVSSLDFMRLSLKERRTRGPVQSCVQQIGAIDGCPILRVLCEGWDTQISPFNLRRKADLFLRRPGPPLFRSKTVDVDNRLCEGLRRFLRQIVADAARDEPGIILAGKLIAGHYGTYHPRETASSHSPADRAQLPGNRLQPTKAQHRHNCKCHKAGRAAK